MRKVVLGALLRAVDEHPPEPPNLRPEDVAAVIGWLHATAAWLREDQAVAAARGHVASPKAEGVLRLYEDAALLFREAYGNWPLGWYRRLGFRGVARVEKPAR